MLGGAPLRLAQRVLCTPPGRALGRPAYRAAAKLAAAHVARVAHVDAVLGTGSITRPELVAPGYSDIDLFVIADVPTIEAELVFRAGLMRAQRRLNVAVPLFRHFDYLETCDLPAIRDLGNAWSLGLDRKFVQLAGRPCLAPGVAPEPAARELEHLMAVLRRWGKASTTLLDPGLGRDPFVDLRGAQRMLSDFLAARLATERLQPLPALLRDAGQRLEPLPPRLAKLIADPAAAQRATGPGAVRELVLAALELLEGWCERFTRSFDGDLVVRAEPSAGAVDEHVRACARRACEDFGFAAAYLAPGTPGTRPTQLVLVASPGEAIEASAARMTKWLDYARARNAPHPLFLTYGLWRAAALLDPSPFVGGTLATARAPLAGAALPAPMAPPPALFARLLVGRAVQGLWRLNGRALRFGRDELEATASTLEELAFGHLCVAALGGEPLSLVPPPLTAERDEHALVTALRDYRVRVRAALRVYAGA